MYADVYDYSICVLLKLSSGVPNLGRLRRKRCDSSCRHRTTCIGGSWVNIARERRALGGMVSSRHTDSEERSQICRYSVLGPGLISSEMVLGGSCGQDVPGETFTANDGMARFHMATRRGENMSIFQAYTNAKEHQVVPVGSRPAVFCGQLTLELVERLGTAQRPRR